MGQRLTQPIFKRGMKFTVVRPIRLSRDTVLEPGHPLEWGELREFHARSLYKRRRIGPRDDAWTDAMLKLWDAGAPNRMPEVGAGEPVPYTLIEPSRNAPEQTSVEPTEEPKSEEGTSEEQPETASSEESSSEVVLKEPVVPVKEGKKWRVPGHEDLFTTKKQAQAHIDAQEASSSEDDDDDAWE